MFANVAQPWTRLVRAGVFTGVTDGAFSSILAAFFYGSTVTKLFQGVASTVIGATAAAEGGAKTAALGWAMHFCVAFTWSAIFLLLYNHSAALRAFVQPLSGKLLAAAVYGPIIWTVMSLAVIPALTHRPTTVTYKWWIQFVGHAPFVALPIVWMISRNVDRFAPVP